MTQDKKSWREQRVKIQPATSEAVYFNDTYPNHILISNPAGAALYIGVNGVVNPSSYDMVIPPYGTRLYARMTGSTRLYLFTDSQDAIDVQVTSWEGEFNPSSVAQSQEMVGAGANGLLGIVEVNNMLSPLPSGNNVIGGVVITDFEQQLPTGNNHIGRFTVEGGEIVVTELPDVAAGYAKVTAAAAGDVVVKNTSGLVYAVSCPLDAQLCDGANTAWSAGSVQFNTPLQIQNSIVIRFASAGDAYVQFK